MALGQLIGSVTRNLAPYFDESKGARASKNWLAFVGRGGGVVNFNNDVNEVKYEITRGSRRVAQLVKRSAVVTGLLGDNAKAVGLGEYTEVSRAFPLSVETYPIGSDKLTEKLPGEPTEDSDVTRRFRATYWAAKGQTELMSQQIRLANLLAGQGILSGKQDSILGDTTSQYDFYRKSTHLKTLGTPWLSNPATCLPLDDLDIGIDACVTDSGAMPEFALMGDAAITGLLKSTQVKEFADNRTFESFIATNDTNVCPAKFNFLTANGWECRGSVTTYKGRKLWIFDSEERLELVAGTTTRSMPSEKVVLGNTESRLDGQYGPSITFPDDAQDIRNYQEWFGFMPGATPKGEPKLTSGVVSPQMFILDAFRNGEKTNLTMRSQMAPLYVPVATDEWYTIENAGL